MQTIWRVTVDHNEKLSMRLIDLLLRRSLIAYRKLSGGYIKQLDYFTYFIFFRAFYLFYWHILIFIKGCNTLYMLMKIEYNN